MTYFYKFYDTFMKLKFNVFAYPTFSHRADVDFTQTKYISLYDVIFKANLFPIAASPSIEIEL